MNSNSLLMLDRVLDQLEELVGRERDENQFLSKVLNELRNSLDAVAVLAIVPMVDDQWVIRGGCGTISDVDRMRVLEQFNHVETRSGPHAMDGTSSNSRHWYAYEISDQWPMLGWIALVFNKPISPSSHAGLQEIVRAFAEILVSRQVHALEHFFQHDWLGIQRVAADVTAASSKVQAAAILVNGFAELFPNTRFSLFERSGSRDCKLISVSSVASIDAKSPVVKSLRGVAKRVIETKKAIVQNSNQLTGSKQVDDGIRPDFIFLPLAARQTRNVSWVLGIEFVSPDALCASLAKLKLLLPTIDLAWDHKAQLLDLPPVITGIFHRSNASRLALRRIAKYSLIGIAIAICVWWLMRPQSLVIEAEGALSPSESKTIFASADGFVAELLVQENDRVQANQPVVRLKSPALELQTEELHGQYRSLEEEARGIRIAMNQLSTSSADQLSEQSVMASKLTDIELQQASITKQLAILESQNAALEIKSPIAGVITGRELRQSLIGRPVIRGDELFSVMNLDSPWQIKVQVADRDSQYVARYYAEDDPAKNPDLRFVLDSSPETHHRARLSAIANRVSNIHREGCFVEVTAQAVNLVREDLRAGGNVHAFFDCGVQPTWFVWLRPFIEGLQRKFWF